MPKKIIEEEIVVNTTRDLAIRKCDTFGNLEIYREGGGVTPKELKGLYTRIDTAERILNAYYAKLGYEAEHKMLANEMRSIQPLDHITYDDDIITD